MQGLPFALNCANQIPSIWLSHEQQKIHIVFQKYEDNYEILEEMNYNLEKPIKIVDTYTINCEIINKGYSPKEKFYLYPYYYISNYKFPFEIIIPNKMKNEASFLFPKQGLYLFIYLILLI